MKPIDVSKRSVGINFNKNGEAEILIWAPEIKMVEIYHNNIRIPLSKNELGYWEATTDQLKPMDLYTVIVDEKELPDPASLAQPEGVHGPSKTFDLNSFKWTDNLWTNIPLKDYIIYELHTGTFTPQGTFTSIGEKLDHLKDLGITAIEIMPVAQFPGNRNWGYDGVFPFAVQNSYGGAEGLANMVNICHKKGMAVVLALISQISIKHPGVMPSILMMPGVMVYGIISLKTL
jgi:maltooligosyltrehalose trehalohydrolase